MNLGQGDLQNFYFFQPATFPPSFPASLCWFKGLATSSKKTVSILIYIIGIIKQI